MEFDTPLEGFYIDNELIKEKPQAYMLLRMFEKGLENKNWLWEYATSEEEFNDGKLEEQYLKQSLTAFVTTNKRYGQAAINIYMKYRNIAEDYAKANNLIKFMPGYHNPTPEEFFQGFDF